ncbi:MAG: phosphatidylserine decarboxylase proenzyme [Planctomycetota bacterium]|nr:MAG: phosphatidylserine decarboxylase proenzyme [Planctomycetota bacterium]
MRWPLTPYGTSTLLIAGLPLCGLAAWAFSGRHTLLGALPALVVIFLIQFFRDPEREAGGDENELISPADGVVADITEIQDADLGTRALRLGVFLNVVNVHVNRVPCAGVIERVSRRPGGFLDARDPRCIEENRAATIVLRRPDGREIGVRQITGLLARRIVCPVQVGDSFERGERYGMIRLGSRTELLVAVDEIDEILVKVGERVRGGETLLARLRPAPAEA